MKTYVNWMGDLHDYLQIGDTVDELMANYFLNVMPPATNTSHLIQMGEPYSHVDGKATFATLEKVEGQWTYKGNCFLGQNEEVL